MIRFAGIQMLVGADKLSNLNKASELVSKAVKAGAKLVSLPECFNCPYGNQYFAEYAEKIPDGQSYNHLKMLALEHKIHLIGGTIPEECDGNLYNTSLVFSPNGELIAKHRKVHLFDIDIPGKIKFKESDTLCPGSSITTFNVNEFTVGLGICYDIRFPEQAHIMRDQGAHIMIYPGAFNMTTGPVYFELLNRARAVDNQVYCSSIAPATDNTATYTSWGHSLICAPTGVVVDSALHDEQIVYCDMSMSEIQDIREGIPTSKQKRSDIYKLVHVQK
ncbi:omega-amidase NIT2-like [Bolinopsis microptera]|uniref:omega-amidase NIT2-like n=1 Tax=Bolinopsis microptera TaxID=2820187 RepID=UPI00307A9DF7